MLVMVIYLGVGRRRCRARGGLLSPGRHSHHAARGHAGLARVEHELHVLRLLLLHVLGRLGLLLEAKVVSISFWEKRRRGHFLAKGNLFY